MTPPINEEDFLVASLAHSTSMGINSSLVRDKDFYNLAAKLNAKDVLMKQQPMHQGMSRAQMIEMERRQQHQPVHHNYPQPVPVPPPVPQYNIPNQFNPSVGDFNSVPILNTDAVSFQVSNTPNLIPMNNIPVNPDGFTSSPTKESTFENFQIPSNFATGKTQVLQQEQKTSLTADMSASVWLQQINANIEKVIEMQNNLEKKLNRMEKRVNVITKDINLIKEKLQITQPEEK